MMKWTKKCLKYTFMFYILSHAHLHKSVLFTPLCALVFFLFCIKFVVNFNNIINKVTALTWALFTFLNSHFI